ncbi:MAG: Gfo/Idh/MocA family oxidoreductase [Caldilineaceae bacterium]|nr:Gfo/Idh/MocA family oxidoreductase [Caldilineaceae bacterium]
MTTIALVGCAHIHTPGFIRRLQARDDVKTVAVWDHDPARAESCAAQLNAPVVAGLDSIWKDGSIEGVIICSETDRHETLVLDGAAAGKHLFVEKPLGMGAGDAYRMADAIEQAGVLFQTGYFQRGIPAHQRLRELVARGVLGQITRARFVSCHSGALRDIFTPQWLWMTDVKQAGVGAFGDLGTHALDLMLWMLGDVARVTATLQVVLDKYGPDCDETGEALFRFSSGAIGSLAAAWVDVAEPVTAEISGTEGHAYIRNRSDLYLTCANLDGADGQSPWTDLPAAWPHAFDLFLNALVAEDPSAKSAVPLVGAREAAYRSAVMEAMYTAAADRSWVALP